MKKTALVEVVPLCKDDLLILPKKSPVKLPGIVLVVKVSSTVHLVQVQPPTMRRVEMTAEQFWRAPFTPFMSSPRLVKFTLLDVEVKTHHHGGGDWRDYPPAGADGGAEVDADGNPVAHPLEDGRGDGSVSVSGSGSRSGSAAAATADGGSGSGGGGGNGGADGACEVEVARVRDLGVNDATLRTTTHLMGGMLGGVGDIVLGFDLEALNLSSADDGEDGGGGEGDGGFGIGLASSGLGHNLQYPNCVLVRSDRGTLGYRWATVVLSIRLKPAILPLEHELLQVANTKQIERC